MKSVLISVHLPRCRDKLWTKQITMKKVKVNAYQVGLVFKNGEYQRLLMAGTYWFWKNECCTDV